MKQLWCVLMGAVSLGVVSCGGSAGGSSSTSSQPVIASAATLSAAEGQPYSYSVAAADPAGTPLTYTLVTKPAGATITGNVIAWTPAHTQARVSNAFTVTVTSAGGASATQSWSVSPTGIIQGTALINYLTDTGVSSQKPSDLASVTIAAYIPSGSTYLAPLPGIGFADGTFTIPNVPAGSFYAKVGDGYYWTTQSTIDLGVDLLGRGDVAQATNPPLLSLAVTSPLQWHQYDELQVYTANILFNNPGDYESTTPIGTFNWSANWNTLPANDTTYISQLTIRPTPSGSQLLALAAATSMPLTLQDGVPANFSPVLSTVLPTANFRLNIAGSALAALRPGNSTNASSAWTYAWLDAMPTGASRSSIGNTPDLILFLNSSVSTDTDYGDVSYGNPFPVSWTPVAGLQDSVQVSYSAPNTTRKVLVTELNYTMTTTMPSASKPLAPLIGSVSNPTIGGGNFYNDLQNVGTTPTLSWQPPTFGTPTSYRIILYEFIADAGGIYGPHSVASFDTTQQSLTIPEGYLRVGKMNYFRIVATYQPTVQFDGHPLRGGFPSAYADAFSGLITP